jgi:phage shock protein A
MEKEFFMSDIDALKAQNENLANLVETANCEKQALEQTVIEHLRSNINLKVDVAALQKKVIQLQSKLSEVSAKLKAFEEKESSATVGLNTPAEVDAA